MTTGAFDVYDVLVRSDTLQGFLTELATAAAGEVSGSVSCGATVRRGPRDPVTFGSSDDFAARLDEIQYAAHDGPCLEALRTGVTVEVDDTTNEERWREYILRSVGEGVRASLSVPVSGRGATLGALNLYARHPREFTAEDRARAVAVAGQVAGALELALRLFERQVDATGQVGDDTAVPRTDLQDVALWLADMARDLDAVRGGQTSLDETCRRAAEVIHGCRWAGINEAQRSQRGETLGASDDTARNLHELQYKLGDGPCLEAIWTDRLVWADDLAVEQRWPHFAADAVKLGARSMLTIQLYTHDGVLGALNLFSDIPGAFDETTRDVAQAFAAQAALAIAGAREQQQLSQALLTRQQIGQATGLLAERHGLTTDEAFRLLVRSSQNHNTKLRDLAARLVTNEDAARHE